MNTSMRNQTAGWVDFAGFLLGHRGSIWRMIHARGSIVLAACLVGTAALAREYDAVSLMDQPQDLLAPFAASIVLATLLFVWMLAALGSMRIRLRQPVRAYAVFLTGYWLTAPLAWLYAIPIESMADEMTSLRFNLTLLSAVSLWRVFLFARVVSIQFRIGFALSLCLLAVPCMAVAFVALLSSTIDIVGVMGGLRLTEAQKALVAYQNAVLGGVFYAFVPVAILATCFLVGARKSDLHWQGTPTIPRFKKSLWCIVVLIAVVFAAAMVWTQPRLRLAARVDALLHANQIRDAIVLMEGHTAMEFPVTWDPPPKYPDRESSGPSFIDIADALNQQPTQPWIVQRLTSQADEIVLWRTEGYGGYRFTNGVERRINASVDRLFTLEATIERLLDVGDLDPDLRRRLEELQIVTASSLQAAIDSELPP